MCLDGLTREESCGAHFREEFQTPDGEAERNDEDFRFVSVWAMNGSIDKHRLFKENLAFEYCPLITRRYK